MRRSAEAPSAVLFNRLIAPLVVAISLFGFAQLYWGNFGRQYSVLAIATLILSSQVFAELNLLRIGGHDKPGIDLRKLIKAWMIVVSVLLFLAYTFKASDLFSRRVLLSWIVSGPFLLFFSQLAYRAIVLKSRVGRAMRRAVIVGAGELGWEFAQRLAMNAAAPLKIAGFFDDRGADRLPDTSRGRLTGTLRELPDYVRSHVSGNYPAFLFSR